jgi:Autophagy protein Apg5
MNLSASPDPVAIASSNYDGKVPVTVTLAPTSLSSPTLPPPIHVLLPRNTYLHIGLSSVIQRLHSFAPTVLSFETGTVKTEPDAGSSTSRGDDVENGGDAAATATATAASSDGASRRRNSIDATTAAATSIPVCWFEDEDTQMALRWHLFVGVLFDLRPPPPPIHSHALESTISKYDDDDDDDGSNGVRPAHTPSLPWRLRLHFNNYPTSQLLPLVGGGRPGSNVTAHVQASYKHSLKQALCLCTGSNRAALNLSRDAHGRLWEALATNNYSLWRQVHEEGHIPTFRGDASTGAASIPVLIPIRLCCNSRPPIQRRCSPVRIQDPCTRTNGSPLEPCEAAYVTLGELLLSWLPEFFQPTKDNAGPDDSNNNSNNSSNTKATKETTTVRPKSRNVTWRVAGLSNLPMEAPLLLLWSHLAHPDHFLYICVVTTTAASRS